MDEFSLSDIRAFLGISKSLVSEMVASIAVQRPVGFVKSQDDILGTPWNWFEAGGEQFITTFRAPGTTAHPYAHCGGKCSTAWKLHFEVKDELEAPGRLAVQKEAPE